MFVVNFKYMALSVSFPATRTWYGNIKCDGIAFGNYIMTCYQQLKNTNYLLLKGFSMNTDSSGNNKSNLETYEGASATQLTCGPFTNTI